jgi:PAS domain S-box-containing protein
MKHLKNNNNTLITNTSIIEISDLNRMENTHFQSALLEHLPYAVFIVEAESGNFVEVNQQAMDMIGYDKAELIYMTVSQINVKVTDWQRQLEILRSVKSYSYPSIYKKKNGDSLAVEVKAKYVVLHQIEYIFAYVTDMSETIRQQQALQESEWKYKNLVEKMNEGLIYLNVTGEVLFANEQFANIFEESAEDMIGKKIEKIFPHEALNELVNAFYFYFDANSDKKIRKQEIAFINLNGEETWLLVHGNVMYDATNTIIGALAVITDITDMKKAQQKLQEKNEELDAFVYKSSHDIKGPLASITGLVNLAMEEESSTIVRKYLDLILRSTQRLDNLILELIDISRLSKQSISFQTESILFMVEKVVNGLKYSQNAEKVDFRIDIPPKLRVYTSVQLLDSILQNLIVNAINYKDETKEKPFVQIKATNLDNFVCLKIQDNGIGISDAIKSKVFDMFFRGTTKAKGTGLGLYIVKNGILKLGGRLEMESDEGIGTTFTIYLPKQ